MPALVLLLRGVMPSGKNKVSMARLREVLSAAGFSRPRTYIQSGNVLVDTDLSAAAVERTVHDLILESLGPDLVIIARTGEQLADALRINPFRNGHDLSRVFFVFFAEEPPEGGVTKLLSRDLGPEKLVFGTNAAIMYIPGQYGKGILSAAFLEKELGVAATMRNFNTVSRLVAKSWE
jgi:uncharacterized protein (DUF1697 family)